MGRDCVFPFEIKQSDGTLRRYNSCDYAHTTPDATEFWQEGCAVVNTTELAVPLNKTFADISAVRSTSATCQVTGTLKSMLSGSSQISLGTFDFDPSEKTATLSTLRITAYCRDPYLMRCAAQSCALHRDESAQCGKYGAPCVACETASCEMGVTQFSSDLGFLKQLLQRVKGKSIFSCKDAEKKFSVNGQALSPAQRRRALGYVTQEDALLPVLSVRETIAFSVNVRLSGAVSRSERDRRVTDAIHALGLDTVADSRIGAAGETGGISGGERRRVSIAAELVVDPLVLLLDEPTSGLDSASAAVVMQRLDGLAKRRRLVIASIHAPRPDVFASFGRILLLSGGRPAYLGPASEAEARFAACGLQCPAAMNIADYLLEATAGDATEALRQLAELPVGRASADLGDVLLLCGRTLKTTFRGPFLVFLHFVTALVLGPVFGALYSTIPNDISGVQNRVGAFFLMQVLWCTLSMSALDMWNEEAHLVSRQRAAGYYSVGAYFAAKAAVDVFFLRVLPPALFAFIFYWVAGFGHDVDKFVVFGSILVLTSLVFGAICMLIGALCSSTRVANVVATLVLLFS
eukprot:g2170.t1